MGMNFPSPAVPGQVYTPVGGYSYVFLDGVWRVVEPSQGVLAVPTALQRNRIVNPAFQVSQENGDSAAISTSYFLADQWGGTCSITPGTVYMIRWPSITSPLGSVNRGILEVVAINAAPTASQYMGFYQKIEGVKITDFCWGTPQARQVILRFGVRCGVAGTFGGAVRGVAAVQCFPFSYTISAEEVNTDVYKTIVVPGCPAGTWPVDNSSALELWWTFATGATYQAPAGAWTPSGTPIGCTGMTNGMAVTAKQFHLFDVGLYLDPDNTGVPPPWEQPDYTSELLQCMRYWRRFSSMIISTYGTAGANVYGHMPISPDMRVAPAVTLVSPSYSNASNFILNSVTPYSFQARTTITAAGMGFGQSSGIFSARL